MKRGTYICTLILFLVSQSILDTYAQITADAAATGISRAFNPAISANVLLDGFASSRSQPLWGQSGHKSGLHYQEMSLEMSSNVDIYLQSKVTISAVEDQRVALEEAYLTSLRMPIPVMLRGGKMLNTFGRHNLYHLHHMAFAEPPMILEQVFGPDLNEVSLEASYLAPLPWYTDVTVGFLNGDNTNLFFSKSSKDFGYLIHLDNLWDLSDEITVRLGGSLLTGPRGLHYPNEQSTPIGPDTTSIRSTVVGADFHLKWKPLTYGRYRSFILQGEYVNASLSVDKQSTDPLQGFFMQALWQINLRWWLQARYDWLNRPQDLHGFFPAPANLSHDQGDALSAHRISVSLALVPTEFSAYRIQYNRVEIAGHLENQLVLQVNVTIGSHPAHKY